LNKAHYLKQYNNKSKAMEKVNKKELVGRLMANYTIAKYGLLKCDLSPFDFMDCVNHLVENTHYIIAEVHKGEGSEAEVNAKASKMILEYDRRLNVFLANGEQGDFDISDFKC
jgi:hypothetical protein